MYLKKYNLKGKYSLVTGAGKGLGRACAIALAEAGSNLILISRTQKDLDSVSKIAKKYKVKSKTYVCDLTNYMKLKKIVEEQKKIDVLILDKADKSFTYTTTWIYNPARPRVISGKCLII